MYMKADLSPKNSLFLFMDPSAGDIPQRMDHLVAYTSTCIAIGSMSQFDGDSVVILTTERRWIEDSQRCEKVFEGSIGTPGKQVAVCTVDLEPVLSMRLPVEQVSVEIWANHDLEPNWIYFLVL